MSDRDLIIEHLREGLRELSPFATLIDQQELFQAIFEDLIEWIEALAPVEPPVLSRERKIIAEIQSRCEPLVGQLFPSSHFAEVILAITKAIYRDDAILESLSQEDGDG
jgi:hypothetical protein